MLWHSYVGPERTALEATAAQFNADHPDIHLVLVAVPHTAFGDKIASAVPRGNGPDLFIYAQDRIGEWADAGVIEPIEFWVDDARAERFREDSLRGLSYKDSLWGLPLAVKSLALFYRSDLVQTPPATTADLLKLAPALRKKGTFAIAYSNADLYGHAPWLFGFGGRVIDDSGKLAIVSPEAANAMAFARKLVDDRIAPADEQDPQVASDFNSGKAAMALQGPWFIPHIEAGVPWHVAPIPVVSATGKPAAPFLGVEGILMSAHAHDKEAAFVVMDALTGDRAAIVRATQARQVVANRHAWDDPEVQRDDVLRAFRTQLEHTVLMSNDPTMSAVWTPYQTQLEEVLSGRADPFDALKKIDDELHRYTEHR